MSCSGSRSRDRKRGVAIGWQCGNQESERWLPFVPNAQVFVKWLPSPWHCPWLYDTEGSKSGKHNLIFHLVQYKKAMSLAQQGNPALTIGTLFYAWNTLPLLSFAWKTSTHASKPPRVPQQFKHLPLILPVLCVTPPPTSILPDTQLWDQGDVSWNWGLSTLSHQDSSKNLSSAGSQLSSLIRWNSRCWCLGSRED